MNSANIIGRMVKEPELKQTSNGKRFINFTLAVDKGLSKAKKEELQSKGIPTADFIQVSAWEQRAEIIARYCTKGSQVGVTGSIQTRSYQKDNGTTVYITEVLANNINLLDSKQQKESTPSFNDEFMEVDNKDLPFFYVDVN